MASTVTSQQQMNNGRARINSHTEPSVQSNAGRGKFSIV